MKCVSVVVEQVEPRDVDAHLERGGPARSSLAASVMALSMTTRESDGTSPTRSAMGMKSSGCSMPRRRVLPANERLDTSDLVGVKVAGGLVVEDEAARLDRVAQLTDERQAPAAVPVVLRSVGADRPVRGLRLVHRDVGASQQLEGRQAVRGEQRDAVARADADRDTIEGDLVGVGVRRAAWRPRSRRRCISTSKAIANSSPPIRAIVASRPRQAAKRFADDRQQLVAERGGRASR